jgi:ketosteroid isomerase-like protein
VTVGLITLFFVSLALTSMGATSFDRQAIRAARTAQNKAIASGDLDGAASFWTEDVTVRRALGQALSGRDAARKALEPAQAPSARLIYQRLTKDVEVSAKWPLAFETGVWEGHQGTIAGPAIVGGRFSAQWVKRGDRWLIRSEVFVALTCSGVGCESVAVP